MSKCNKLTIGNRLPNNMTILLILICNTSVCVSCLEQKNCVDPKANAYVFDSYRSSIHRRLLSFLEEDNQLSSSKLICEFGMDIITIKVFLQSLEEGLKDEVKNIMNNPQQYECSHHGCSHIIHLQQTMINELAYMNDVLEGIIEKENTHRSLRLIHEVYDVLDVLQNAQYNALVKVITQLEYSRLKTKIETDDLEDIPEVRLLLKKMYQ